jgi:hypothetical protein
LCKLVFRQAFFTTLLWRNAGHQASFGGWQYIGGGLAVKTHRLVDDIQVKVGAHTGKLGRS